MGRSWVLLSASGPSKSDLGSILVLPRRILEPHREDFVAFWDVLRLFLVSDQCRHEKSNIPVYGYTGIHVTGMKTYRCTGI